MMIMMMMIMIIMMMIMIIIIIINCPLPEIKLYLDGHQTIILVTIPTMILQLVKSTGARK
jgi:hypothetical protein